MDKKQVLIDRLFKFIIGDTDNAAQFGRKMAANSALPYVTKHVEACNHWILNPPDYTYFFDIDEVRKEFNPEKVKPDRLVIKCTVIDEDTVGIQKCAFGAAFDSQKGWINKVDYSTLPPFISDILLYKWKKNYFHLEKMILKKPTYEIHLEQKLYVDGSWHEENFVKLNESPSPSRILEFKKLKD